MLEILETRTQNVLDLSLIKNHLKIETEDDDAYLLTLLSTATSWVEHYLQKTLITKKYRYLWIKREEPASVGYHIVPIPRPPVLRILEINSFVKGEKKPIKRISFDIQTENPCMKFSDVHEKIELIYTAGYGDTQEYVPEIIKHCVMVVIQNFYEKKDFNPEPAKEMLKCYKTMNLI